MHIYNIAYGMSSDNVALAGTVGGGGCSDMAVHVKPLSSLRQKKSAARLRMAAPGR
jgi:hypothetical protein